MNQYQRMALTAHKAFCRLYQDQSSGIEGINEWWVQVRFESFALFCPDKSSWRVMWRYGAQQGERNSIYLFELFDRLIDPNTGKTTWILSLLTEDDVKNLLGDDYLDKVESHRYLPTLA